MKPSTLPAFSLLACLLAANLAAASAQPPRIGGTTDRTGRISGIGGKPSATSPSVTAPPAPRTIHRDPAGKPIGSSIQRNGRTEYTGPDGRPAGSVRNGAGAPRPIPGTTPPQLRGK